MSSPRTQLYQEIRKPELQSLTYPIVVELVEFKRKDLPTMIYTTHIRLWKKGRITSVLEINGNGGPDCNRSRAKRAIADHSATIDLQEVFQAHTARSELGVQGCTRSIIGNAG